MAQIDKKGSTELPDDNSTAPTGKSDGYASVAYISSEGRIYFFVNDSRYYLTGTHDPEATPANGNPIGLLLALTYAGL